MTADQQLSTIMGIMLFGFFALLIGAAWRVPSLAAKIALVALPALYGVGLFWAGVTNPDTWQMIIGGALLGGSATAVFREQLR